MVYYCYLIWSFSFLFLPGPTAFAGARSAQSELQTTSPPSLVDLHPTYGAYVKQGHRRLGHKPLRLVFISDSHSRLHLMSQQDPTLPTHLKTLTRQNTELLKNITYRNLPTGDILFVSGDFTQTGKIEEMALFREFIDYILKHKGFRHVVIVAGNHERTLDRSYYRSTGFQYHEIFQDPDVAYAALFQPESSQIHYLNHESITLEGIKIFGSPYVRGGSFWGFSLDSPQLAEKWQDIPADTDILVTHMPPYGHGDITKVIQDYREVENHGGSTSLLEKVLQVKPKIHAFGHMHEGYGISQSTDGATLFINSAICNEGYAAVNRPIIVDDQY